MKKTILTCLMIAGGFFMASAQEQNSAPTPSRPPSATAMPQRPPMQGMPKPEDMANRRVKSFEKALNLSPEQSKKAYEAELQFAQLVMPAKPGPGAVRPSNEAIQAGMAKKDEQYKQFLTADQWKKYDVMRPKMPSRPQPPVAPASAPPAGN